MPSAEALSGGELTRLRSALDEAAIIAITDRQGVITYANDKFCAISKYDRSELIGKTHRVIRSETHSDAFFADLWRTISSGKIWEGEIRNRAKDGSYYWVHTTIVPFFGVDGQPERYVSVRYETTERKLFEEQLHVYARELRRSNSELEEFASIIAHDKREVESQKESFKTLFNSTHEGLVVHERGRISDVNRGATKILAADRGQVTRTWLSQYIRVDHRAKVEEALAQPFIERVEAVVVHKDGSEAPIELANREIILAGKTVSLAIISDLTWRKQMEAQILQQDRLASLGLLSSSLAHEIGTPLGIIRSRAELVIKKSQSSPAVVSDLAIIVSQIDKIAKLVNSLLSLARNKPSEIATAVDLNETVADVLNLVRHELDRKGIVLEMQIQDRYLVKAESGPLAQVLLNLLVNSIHAIEEVQVKEPGEKNHRIILRAAASLRGTVEILVQDTGCGIPEKNFAQLFKPFFTTKDIGHGTGLGLATSFKLVKSWGGSMRVDSKGRGALFAITLNSCGRECEV